MQVCHQSFVFDVFWAHVDQDHSIERPFGVTEDGETGELSTEEKKQWIRELRLHEQIVVLKKRVAVEIKRKIMKSRKEMSRKVWENLSFEDKMQLRRDLAQSYKKCLHVKNFFAEREEEES